MRPVLKSQRLTLEPVAPEHFWGLWEIYRDESLHAYVPKQPMTYEESLDRFNRWSRETSTTGKTIFNWAGKNEAGEIVGHYQIQVEDDETATVGYIIKKSHHRQGFAFEGLKIVFDYLVSNFAIRAIRASIDARNDASINLAKKLGMQQTEYNRNANISKDGTSDECIYTLVTEAAMKELQL